MDQKLIKPQWLKIKLNKNENFLGIKDTLTKHNLHTVCESAHCPNIQECWSGGTATFMVMGDVCTRGCKFCAVKTGNPMKQLDKGEPKKLAAAIAEIGMFDYVVITSVDRDDLEDQGSGHFAECIKEVKNAHSGILVEVLIPDFRGNPDLLRKIVDAKPNVIAHNIETVESLQRYARDVRANYRQSLSVLENVKKMNKNILTKSALMVGIGESDEEIIQSLKDLRAINCDLMTIGQYLRPSNWHIPIKDYVSPEKFKFYEQKALELGFKYCACGPFVRSSYKAGELFVKNVLKNSCF